MAAPLGRSVSQLASRLSRLCVGAANLQVQRQIHSQGLPLQFHASMQLWGEPLKKKKKLDPQILIQREQKRRKKIEKQMKRLEKFGKKLKPVEEIDGNPKLYRELKLRQRAMAALSAEDTDTRALQHKAWSRYKMAEFKREHRVLLVAMETREEALQELRLESEELYQMALQTDEGLTKVSFKGPVSTPPIKDYEAPDGAYKNTTKTYE